MFYIMEFATNFHFLCYTNVKAKAIIKELIFKIW